MMAANKQNILLLQNQLKIIKNGFKLLQEKRSGLVIMLLDFASKGKRLEQELQQDWEKFMPIYTSALGLVSSSNLISNLEIKPTMSLKIDKKRASGVYLDMIKIILKPPIRYGLKKNIGFVLTKFAKLFPIFLKINELKLNCYKIAKEIEKTNRQINNLQTKSESILDEIKKMKSVLSERANQEKAILIKLFG